MNIMIIGAGIAGLSCATSLQAAGHRVIVFDKSRGPSGRMSTRRAHGNQWDHGAQYFTARNPLFQAEVQRWITAGAAAPWEVSFAVIGNADAHTDAPGLVRYVGMPRMTSPAKLLSESLTLKSEHTVQSIRRDDASWRFSTLEHGLINTAFDAVVLALPVHQAMPLLQGINHHFVSEIEGVKMVGSWTLMLGYENRQDMGFDGAFVNQGPLRWIARDNSKPGRISNYETWVLQASAAWSERYIEAPPTEVIPELLAAFRDLGGSDPDECIAHRWRYADTQTPHSDQFLWDNYSKLGICGDWINGGKVEGAWLSGLKLSEKINKG